MAQITVYMRPTCPYCVRAIALLNSKGVEFETIDLQKDPSQKPEMVQRAGRTSVPQIFIGDRHVGGCDDLHELDAAGLLDGMLGNDASQQA